MKVIKSCRQPDSAHALSLIIESMYQELVSLGHAVNELLLDNKKNVERTIMKTIILVKQTKTKEFIDTLINYLALRKILPQ